MKFLMESRETHNLIGSHDAAGLTIMHYAVVGGNPDMIDLLISKVCTMSLYVRIYVHPNVLCFWYSLCNSLRQDCVLHFSGDIFGYPP